MHSLELENAIAIIIQFRFCISPGFFVFVFNARLIKFLMQRTFISLRKIIYLFAFIKIT